MQLNLSKKITPAAADPYAQQVTAEAIKILFHNLPNISYSVMVMILVMMWVMWVMWERVNHVTLLAWAATAFTMVFFQIGLSKAFFKQNPPMEQIARWGRYYTYHSVVDGFVWGSACVLFFVSDSAVLQVFLFTCVVGIATSAIIHCSYWIESYYAFIIPLLSLSGLRLFWEGGSAYQGLAGLTMLLMVLVLQMAHESKKSVYSAIRLRFENLDLIEKLNEEKEKAEIASRDKTRFLASASHDLRQPVHALTLFADAIKSELATEKSKALLGNMERSIEAINQLLGSLLDISKLDANIVKVNLEHFSLSPLLIQLDAEYAPQAHAKGLVWRISFPDLVVHSDKALLETMLRNFISNAIRYTNNGYIEIKCTQQSEEVYIEIMDSGIGIAEDQQKKIFREFYQVENFERDRSKGLGLGLAIVNRVASLLQHKILLESTLGHGSRFTIVLPVGEQRSITAPAVTSVMLQSDLIGMLVLVIEDEEDVLEGMQVMLEGWGCVVILATSEDEAMEKASREALPQVIVADYRLRDGKNGADAIKQVRLALGADIPGLIITGDTDPARMQEALASGLALMHKPVQPGKLRTYLRGVQRRQA
jgi:signal transduction histidine kinase